MPALVPVDSPAPGSELWESEVEVVALSGLTVYVVVNTVATDTEIAEISVDGDPSAEQVI
jgi:hypothetical protein